MHPYNRFPEETEDRIPNDHGLEELLLMQFWSRKILDYVGRSLLPMDV
jgi:hypothetical protein